MYVNVQKWTKEDKNVQNFKSFKKNPFSININQKSLNPKWAIYIYKSHILVSIGL